MTARQRDLLLGLPFIGYAAWLALRGAMGPEHVGAIVLVYVLAFAHPRTKTLLYAVYPIALVGLLYDAMRPFQQLGLSPERVHLCDVRAVESRLFGYEVDGVRRTLHDWFQAHHTPAVDLLCAFPYGTFILVSFAAAAYLGFRDPGAMRRFTWGFFAMNVAGFVTYHVFPTAPPWYYHAHGCTIDLATRATEGPVLARVDAMLGISYFHGMYAKASSVFGAIPSLHCAYPCLVMIEGWRTFGPRLRALSVAYWLLMIFASMYLDHHWLIDGLLGSTYAAVTAIALRRIIPNAPPARARRGDEPALGPSHAAEAG